MAILNQEEAAAQKGGNMGEVAMLEEAKKGINAAAAAWGGLSADVKKDIKRSGEQTHALTPSNAPVQNR